VQQYLVISSVVVSGRGGHAGINGSGSRSRSALRILIGAEAADEEPVVVVEREPLLGMIRGRGGVSHAVAWTQLFEPYNRLDLLHCWRATT